MSTWSYIRKKYNLNSVGSIDFSFGIITTQGQTERLHKIVKSIRDQNIPNYEIIIVGNTSIDGDDIISVEFDEHQKKKWITRKKNIITQNASFENVVYLHDYIIFLPGWYEGFVDFGDDFNVCMNKIINYDGQRFADWCLDACLNMEQFKENRYKRVIPYDMVEKIDLSKMMYISGAYWVAKKRFMESVPLNEKFCWGQGEDVEWSHRARRETSFSFNKNSCVKIIKKKSSALKTLSDNTKKILLNLSQEEIEKHQVICELTRQGKRR